MKKIMISQPMAGKTEEEIKSVREKVINILEKKGYEFISSLFTDNWNSEESMIRRGVVNKSLHFLSASIEIMSKCHAVYFCKDWEKARGCKIEHEIAKAYGLEIIYE